MESPKSNINEELKNENTKLKQKIAFIENIMIFITKNGITGIFLNIPNVTKEQSEKQKNVIKIKINKILNNLK